MEELAAPRTAMYYVCVASRTSGFSTVLATRGIGGVGGFLNGEETDGAAVPRHSPNLAWRLQPARTIAMLLATRLMDYVRL